MQTRLGKLDHLIASCYEAALQPHLWRSALAEASHVFGAEGICLYAWPYGRDDVVWSEGLDEFAQHFFGNGWHTRNARLSRAMPLRHTKAVLTQADIFTLEELDRLPFNAELVNPLGFRWAAGSFVGPAHALTGFNAERKAKYDPFGTAEIEAMEAFFPHLHRTVQVAHELAMARGEGMVGAFEAMNCAAVLIDALGKVQCLNAHARRHLDTSIRILHGQLTTCHKDANDSLQRLMASLLRPSQPGRETQILATIPREDGRPLFACGIPIMRSAEDIFQQSKVILVIVDPDEHLNPPELILRQGFKLTPAETRLALALAQGCTLRDYADIHQVSVGTVRVQLKAVMAKTSTHRQAELVSLLAQLSQALPSHLAGSARMG